MRGTLNGHLGQPFVRIDRRKMRREHVTIQLRPSVPRNFRFGCVDGETVSSRPKLGNASAAAPLPVADSLIERDEFTSSLTR